MIILTNILRVAHGGWVNSGYCYSPGLIDPTLLRHITLPSTGGWELAEVEGKVRVGVTEPVVHGKSMKGPKPSSWPWE